MARLLLLGPPLLFGLLALLSGDPSSLLLTVRSFLALALALALAARVLRDGDGGTVLLWLWLWLRVVLPLC